MEYDKVRKAEAQAHGIRISTLDAEVEKARRAQASTTEEQSQALVRDELQPWPEAVDIAAALDELTSIFQRFAVLPPHAAEALALWVLFTYCIDAFQVAPILALTSPEKRCGKTTVLAILGRLSYRPLSSANITAAALFRAVEKFRPTLLIDEADTFLRYSDELRGILNSGYTRDNAYVIRTVGEDYEPRPFTTWGAKAIACIGRLPETLSDRSIEVALRRKLPGETVEKLRHARETEFHRLTRQLLRWATDHSQDLRHARPRLPDGLHDRAADNWEPLLAIADLAGSHWPTTARKVAVALSLSAATSEDSLQVALLDDLRQVWESSNAEKLFSGDIVQRLLDMPERPWREGNRGGPITPHWLAKRLRRYEILPRDIRIATKNGKGYERTTFDDAFARYLPDLQVRQGDNPDVARVSGEVPSVTAPVASHLEDPATAGRDTESHGVTVATARAETGQPSGTVREVF
jgi:putative DNA primase/helicase